MASRYTRAPHRCTIRYDLVQYFASFSFRSKFTISRLIISLGKNVGHFRGEIGKILLGRKVAVVYRRTWIRESVEIRAGRTNLAKILPLGEVSDSNSISRLAVPFL